MAPGRRVRFGPFELDLESGDLRREGDLLRLEPQPRKVLQLLASRAGQVVSRREIQGRIWPDDTFVDFDQGLNYCIRQIRGTLGDSADAPRFIETLPRRGYRFTAAAQLLTDPQPLTLAVLPFEPILRELPDESLELGLADAIITRLSAAASLVVPPLTAIRRFRSPRQDSLSAARELGATLVVEGSVHRVEQRVRATARLLDVVTGRARWAGVFNERQDDLFAVLDAISSQIAQDLLQCLHSTANDRPLARIRELTRDWTATEFERSYGEGKWTARQILIHLAQTEIGLGHRARMVLASRDYVAQPFDQNAWIARETSLSGPAALEALVGLHAMNEALFASLSPAERAKPFVHPDYGTLTVDWIVQLLESHLAHHVVHLERIADPAFLTDPGPTD
jgi:DNA-binding winged helix-turn-helix (wHTH) protein